MAIALGTRFGPYEIAGAIGSGGMGEVYRAKDTSLKRDVAIKILPKAFADDADRVARFQREAEALAALNHSNIAQIYGLERGEGSTALVLELVEGPTLGERIAQGAIPYDEALGIALQVANALEAAHGQGIVHRDLKPANIKVRPDGTVKVLDFGIATAPESPRATSGKRSPALLTPALTEAGILLGTAAYMSPEQARGKPVDERADIWAFGCVLYEVLTGQPAFQGEDVTTTLARVLERETDLGLLPSTVPPVVRHTLELCLEKDPGKRIADIRDVRLALAGRFETETRGGSGPSGGARPAWRRALPLAAGLVAGGILVALAGAVLWPEPAPRPVMRLKASIERGPNPSPVAVISPDGSRVGFRAGPSAQIHVRDLDDFDARPIPGTEDPSAVFPPCFSPDGAWIAYTTGGGGELKKAPLAGGAALTVAEGLDVADVCDWAEDGYIYFGTTPGIMRVVESGGEAETVAAYDGTSGELSYEVPQLLPGGTQVLFSVLGSGGMVSPDVAVLDLATRETKIVLEGAGFATYAQTGPGAAQGHLVYGRSGALFAAPFDLRTLEAGPASPVLEGVMQYGPFTLATVSETGTLAYLAGAGFDIGTSLRWVDRAGTVQVLPEPAHTYGSLVLSPDGRRAAVDIFDLETLTGDLWLYELDGERLTRLTFGGLNFSPVWMPDGERLIYVYADALPANDGELRVVPADNSAPPVTLAAVQGGPAVPTSVSSDGTVVIGTRFPGGTATNGDLWSFRLEDATVTPGAAPPAPGGAAATDEAATASADAASATLEPLLATDFNERDAGLSPDGRFLAYTSNESGRDEVYVVPYPGPGGKTQVSAAGGTLPRWNPNGRELFYASGTQLMAVEVETSAGFRRLTPRVLFDAPQLTSGNSDMYDVAPDGTRFLMTVIGETDTDEELELRVVVNWFEELRELAPRPAR